jgi:hypothetical protein
LKLIVSFLSIFNHTEIKDPIKKGGVISKAVSKTETDWLIYRASSIPGPKYDLPPMRV